MESDHSVLTLELMNNRSLLYLLGEQALFVKILAKTFQVSISNRGNIIQIAGNLEGAQKAQAVLRHCYDRLEKGLTLDAVEYELIIQSVEKSSNAMCLDTTFPPLATGRKDVFPRSAQQHHYLRRLQDNDLVFVIGPAGTGKTYLAVAVGVSMLLSGQVERLILSRPAVEAGERLGFLPGDLREKVDPYLRPLYDALHDMLTGDQVIKRLNCGDIEVAPLAFMRGRTLGNAFVILDEAQNTTPEQMKMFLTRLGPRSRMVVTGDLTQIDLPKGTRSGLEDAKDTLINVKGISFVYFSLQDVVRHSLVTRILQAYGAYVKK